MSAGRSTARSPAIPEFRRGADRMAGAGRPHSAHLQAQGAPVLQKPPDHDDDFQWLALMRTTERPPADRFHLVPVCRGVLRPRANPGRRRVWAINPGRIHSRRIAGKPVRMDPRDEGNFRRYFLKGDHRFIWMGEPHTMNRRLIAQSGTFAVPGVLDVPIERILSGADQENILAKFILTNAVREVGMRELYRMNITYATFSPIWTAWRSPGLRAGVPLGLQPADHGTVSHLIGDILVAYNREEFTRPCQLHADLSLPARRRSPPPRGWP